MLRTNLPLDTPEVESWDRHRVPQRLLAPDAPPSISPRPSFGLACPATTTRKTHAAGPAAWRRIDLTCGSRTSNGDSG